MTRKELVVVLRRLGSRHEPRRALGRIAVESQEPAFWIELVHLHGPGLLRKARLRRRLVSILTGALGGMDTALSLHLLSTHQTAALQAVLAQTAFLPIVARFPAVGGQGAAEKGLLTLLSALDDPSLVPLWLAELPRAIRRPDPVREAFLERLIVHLPAREEPLPVAAHRRLGKELRAISRRVARRRRITDIEEQLLIAILLRADLLTGHARIERSVSDLATSRSAALSERVRTAADEALVTLVGR